MANTSKLTKDERKKSKRTARKKRKAEKPLKRHAITPCGSKKPKVKKLARGQGEAGKGRVELVWERALSPAPLRSDAGSKLRADG